MKVRFYATLRSYVGGRSVELADPPETVGAVLARLCAEHDGLGGQLFEEDGSVRRFVAVMVDGRDIRHREGLETRVAPTSELDIFPPVAGG